MHLKFSGNGWRELIRYAIFGLIPAGCDVVILYILHNYYHLPANIAVALAFIIGTTVAYFLSVTIIFKHYIRQKMRREYTTFLGICAVGFVLNQLIVFGLCALAWQGTDGEINLWTAKALSVVVVGLFQFLAKKHYLFNHVNKSAKV